MDTQDIAVLILAPVAPRNRSSNVESTFVRQKNTHNNNSQLPCAMCYSKYFICVNSFDPYNNLMMQGAILSLFYI